MFAWFVWTGAYLSTENITSNGTTQLQNEQHCQYHCKLEQKSLEAMEMSDI